MNCGLVNSSSILVTDCNICSIFLLESAYSMWSVIFPVNLQLCAIGIIVCTSSLIFSIMKLSLVAYPTIDYVLSMA